MRKEEKPYIVAILKDGEPVELGEVCHAPLLFEILTEGGGETAKGNAVKIRNYESYNFAVHINAVNLELDTHTMTLTELTTGRSVAQGESIEEAMEMLVASLDEVGETKFLELLAELSPSSEGKQ